MNVADADAIVAAAEAAERVVMVGYMKRYDPAVRSAYERRRAGRRGAPLRGRCSPTTPGWRDPRSSAMTSWCDRDPPPNAAAAALAAAEAEQVEAAVGRGDPAAVKAFSYVYLSCLIHDVNLVHGALSGAGVSLPLEPVSAGHWADGHAASVAWQLPSGGRWNCTWLLLEGLEEFRESVSFYAADAIHRLTFPAPYLRQAPTLLESTVRARRRDDEVRRGALSESFVAELEHFHDCIALGVACETPPEQARVDIEALQRAFGLAADEQPPGRHRLPDLRRRRRGGPGRDGDEDLLTRSPSVASASHAAFRASSSCSTGLRSRGTFYVPGATAERHPAAIGGSRARPRDWAPRPRAPRRA